MVRAVDEARVGEARGVTLDRRGLFALPAAVALPGVAAAQGPPPPLPPVQTVRLWPGEPPGGPPAAARRGTAMPSIGIHRPARPDGRGVLVVPGGGYSFVAVQNEGAEVAQRLARHGITAFVLDYRLPVDGWRDRADVPLQDAQRAMRLIRANAVRLGIDAKRLSVLGFSAGGHLAGALTTLHELRVYEPVDAADRESARPATAALGYAVSNLSPGRSRGGSRESLLGPDPDLWLVDRYAIDRRLSGAPPLFLFAAEDDRMVPVANTLDLAAAARAFRVSVEMHLFNRGGHGFGVRLPETATASLWPDLYVRWLV
jgi:acetyl esterase/lipase